MWIRDGIAPPASRIIQIGRDKNGRRIVAVDANGNALGGVRHPMVEVPRGTYLAHNTPTPCFLTGAFIEFAAPRLQALYPSSAFYMEQVRRALKQAIYERFLLPEASPTIISQALQHATESVDLGRP
jgi:hypothetical protein